MLEHVPPHLLHAYNLYDRTAKTGITNSCNYPHKAASIDVEGNCMVCACDGWLPISVCNVKDINGLDQIWNNGIAQKIQKDVDDKKFTWCSVDTCGVKTRDRFVDRHYISVNVDESCNLACPSCRRSKINRTSGNEFLSRESIAKNLVDLINKFDKPIEIMMSGNGDPFASLIYRPLLLEMEPRDNVSIRMLTNGLLLKKLMPKMKSKKNIKHLDISIDAGDSETYEKVRLGGKWSTLLENLDYVKENVDCTVTLKFVLQKDNIDSVDNFVRLMEQYGFNGNIMPIENWGAMDNFAEHDVFASDHPMNARVKDILARYGNQPGLFFHSINKF
jgi:wyosine [tRNA(Phe)-imidazoG37] synthetase (radical SAM superfamily)